MRKIVGIILCTLLCLAVVCAGIAQAGTKKGLLVYDSVYGSTSETAYWIKAIIGHQEQLDVKSLPQVITVKPYDYVIIGSLTRWEKPSEKIYKFVEMNRAELAKKQVCYYLNCGDSDETMVLKAPGQKAHLIAGRNYLLDIMNKFPDIKPVVIGGFGGRQTFPSLGTKDRFWTWLVGKLAKEGAAWEGLDIWESLVPARVEAFADEVRVKVLGLPPCENVQQFRGYWESLQPASLTDASKKKYEPRAYTTKHSTERIYYTRSRIKGELNQAVALLQQWAKENGFDLREQVKTYYNVYYQAAKMYAGTEIILHVVPSTLPEDPGTVHISFRCYDKPDARTGAEADITKAEQLLWADGRKVE
jgi:menaquinone-dependent protoporphyrinogen IX oxidase